MADHNPETHLDIPLDDEPSVSRAPVFVDVVAKVHDRAPIVPAGWRGWANIRSTLRFHAGLLGYRTGYHGTRLLTRYFWLVGFWGVVGLFRLAGRQIRWWWVIEAVVLSQHAANQNNWYDYKAALDKGRQVRLYRGLVLLAELLAIAALVVALSFQPVWMQVLVVVLALPVLAHFGRPVDQRIVTPAVVTPRFRRINPDIVLRAYYSAKLGSPDKPDQQIKFGSTMARDQKDTGSLVTVDMPYGLAFSDVVKAKEALASGLDVTEFQVFLTRDKTSARRHHLFVADRDPLAIPAGKTDMLDLKPRNVWRPVRLGRDERDRLVTLLLLWQSFLIGAQPRKGKTFFARLLGLYAALDPYVRICLADGKMSPDWNKFGLVAHRMVIGDAANPRDSDPLGHLEEMLDEVLAHIKRVNDELSQLPPGLVPEGKLTEALARDPRYPNLFVLMLIMEEFQVYFETVDQDFNKRIAGKLARIQAVGPSAGVIVVSSSQKPSGVGAGDVGRLFNRYRDNHPVRFALKCGNRNVSEAILGDDAYGEGYNAAALPNGPEYRGVGILYGASDDIPTVRTFLADHIDAERILLAARRYREQAGTLSGQAAGEDMAREARDVLADVIRVFADTSKTRLQWEQLAELMASTMPETYAGLTADAISAQVRAEGVPGRNVRDGASVKQGCVAADVQTAIDRRAIKA